MSSYALLSYDYGKAIFSILASFSRESFKYEIFKDFRAKTLNPVLWYVNRKSITRAIFVGTFSVYCLYPFIVYLLLWQFYCLKLIYLLA